MIRLISHPNQYNGKWIRLTGFLSVQDQLNALFLTKEAMQTISEPDAVWLVLDDREVRAYEEVDRRYAVVTGLFRAEHCHDTAPCFAGNMERVSILAMGPQYKDLKLMLPGITK
jgi:hypothetical protein